MTILLDVIAVGIIVLFAVLGYKRGVSHSIRTLVVIAAAVASAYFLSDPITDSIYNGSFKQDITSSIAESLEEQNAPKTVKEALEEKFDIKLSAKDVQRVAESERPVALEIKLIAKEKGVTLTESEINKEIKGFFSAEKLEESLGENSKTAVEFAQKLVDHGEEKLSDMIKAFADSDYDRAAKKIENSVARPAIKSVIKPLCMILLFIVTIVIVKLAFFVLSVAKIIPIAKTGASAVGALFGLGQAMLILLLLATALSSAMRSEAIPSSLITEQMIEDTIVFKAFY